MNGMRLLTILIAMSLTACSNAAEPVPAVDISCDISIPYIGNEINNEFKLKISGTETKEWLYSVKIGRFDWPKSKEALLEYQGTYELEDDLVIFTTSKVTPGLNPIRVGLNYGIIDGSVQFNDFFRNHKGEFTYHSKIFTLIEKKWQPAEELRLQLETLPELNTKEWKLSCKGFHSRWDLNGKVSTKQVEFKQTFIRSQNDRLEEYQLDHRTELLPEVVSDSICVYRQKQIVTGINQVGNGGICSGFTLPITLYREPK